MNKLDNDVITELVQDLYYESEIDNTILINEILNDADYIFNFTNSQLVHILRILPNKFKELVDSDNFGQFRLGNLANELLSDIPKTNKRLSKDELDSCIKYIRAFTEFSFAYYLKPDADTQLVDDFLTETKSYNYLHQRDITKICANNPRYMSIIDFDKFDQRTFITDFFNIDNYYNDDLDKSYFEKYKAIYFSGYNRLIDKITDIKLLDEIANKEYRHTLWHIAKNIIDADSIFNLISEKSYIYSINLLSAISARLMEQNKFGKFEDIFDLHKRYDEFDFNNWRIFIRYMNKNSRGKIISDDVIFNYIKSLIKSDDMHSLDIFDDELLDIVIKHLDDVELLTNLNEYDIYSIYRHDITVYNNKSFREICLPKMKQISWKILIKKDKKYYEHHKQLLKQG